MSGAPTTFAVHRARECGRAPTSPKFGRSREQTEISGRTNEEPHRPVRGGGALQPATPRGPVHEAPRWGKHRPERSPQRSGGGNRAGRTYHELPLTKRGAQVEGHPRSRWQERQRSSEMDDSSVSPRGKMAANCKPFSGGNQKRGPEGSKTAPEGSVAPDAFWWVMCRLLCWPATSTQLDSWDTSQRAANEPGASPPPAAAACGAGRRSR